MESDHARRGDRAPQWEEILLLCVANGAREYVECEGLARMAGRVRNAELLVTLRK